MPYLTLVGSIDGLHVSPNAQHQTTKNIQRCRLRTLAMRGVSGKAIVSRDSAYCMSAEVSIAVTTAYRSGHISTGDSLRGSVEEVKGGRLADLGNDLGSDTEG